jgi:type IV fimbrial biogenesis protein FimT
MRGLPVSFTKAFIAKVSGMKRHSVNTAGTVMHAGRRVRGFTLIELIMTMTVAAILLAIGVPSFLYVTSSNRATSEINGLLGDLQFARGEAIKEGQTVTICSSTDGATCAGTTAWNNGWIVFSDTGLIGTVDGTDYVLKMQRTFSGTDALTSDNAITTVTFTREGFTSSLPTGGMTFTLHTSPVNTNYTRCLSATIVGAISTQIYGVTTAEGVPCT